MDSSNAIAWKVRSR